jgi:hypothetical protein
MNKKSRVSSISFSDIAEDWLVKQLNKMKEGLDIKRIEEFAKNNHIKDGNIIIPLVIRSEFSSCKTRGNFHWFKKYFQFNGQNLQESHFFLNPVEIVLLSTGH